MENRQAVLKRENQILRFVEIASGIAGEALADRFGYAAMRALTRHEINPATNVAALLGTDLPGVRTHTQKTQGLVSGRKGIFQPALVRCRGRYSRNRTGKFEAMTGGSAGHPGQRNTR